MSFSIRKRLLWTMLSTLLVLAVGASSVTYMRARSDINKLFDYEMEQMVYALAMHIASHPELTEEPLLRIEHDFVTQVWSKTGKLLFSSKPGTGPVAVLENGFSDYGGSTGWRTFTTGGGNYVLQAAHPQTLRRKLATDIALNAMLPILAIVPIGGALVWLLLGYGLAPLRLIAREVESRDPKVLLPLSLSGRPSEIMPLVYSLNDLLGRLDRALKVEREFIADASHELRSPVTALQLQLELLESTREESGRAELIADIRQGVSRISRLIEQILTLARLDPDYGAQTETIRLQEFVTGIYEDLQPQAAAKSIRFSLNADSPASISGDATSLRALLRNLVDNAIRYTPVNGAITIELSTSDKGAEITITDTGPGMSGDLRRKAFARFYRGDNVPETTGTGLGLAIARRAADRLGARLTLEDGRTGSGLTAVVGFPEAVIEKKPM
ncbi:MAG: two-component sensor histidine kinase [Burkholderiales bacterium]|nr:two-component sensor histidine kinase [Burkholderiales bacterium]